MNPRIEAVPDGAHAAQEWPFQRLFEPEKPKVIPRIGALEDLGAQLAAIHVMADRIETALHRVLKPAVCSEPPDDYRASGPIAEPHVRDLVRGANRAANRLAAIVDRIDL